MFEKLQELATAIEKGVDVDSSTFSEEFVRVMQKCLDVTGTTLEGRLMVYTWFINLYKQHRPELDNSDPVENMTRILFQGCARTVLDQDFAALIDSEALVRFLEAVTDACATMRSTGQQHRFVMIQYLCHHPWNHPILLPMITGQPVDQDLAMQYLDTGEFPELFHLRVQLLRQKGCDDMALNLCNWCTQHDKFRHDTFIRGNQLVLLYEAGYKSIVWEECLTLPCCIGKEIVHCLQEEDSHQEATLELAQTFLVQDWLRPRNYCCTKELLHHWLSARRQVDPEDSEFLFNVGKLLEMASSSWQLMALVDAMHILFGSEFMQFYMEVCVLTLVTDKHNLLLAKQRADAEEEALINKQLSFTCSVISCLGADWCLNLRRLSMLTALSLDPQLDVYRVMKKLFALKHEDHDVSDEGAVEEEVVVEKTPTKQSRKESRRTCQYFRIPKVSSKTTRTVISLLYAFKRSGLDPKLPQVDLNQRCLKLLIDVGVLPKSDVEGHKVVRTKPSESPKESDLNSPQKNGLIEKHNGQSEVLKDQYPKKDKIESLKGYRPKAIWKSSTCSESSDQGKDSAVAGDTAMLQEMRENSAADQATKGSDSAPPPTPSSPSQVPGKLPLKPIKQQIEERVMEKTLTEKNFVKPPSQEPLKASACAPVKTLPGATQPSQPLPASVQAQSASALTVQIPASSTQTVKQSKFGGTLVLNASSLESFIRSAEDSPLASIAENIRPRDMAAAHRALQPVVLCHRLPEHLCTNKTTRVASCQITNGNGLTVKQDNAVAASVAPVPEVLSQSTVPCVTPALSAQQAPQQQQSQEEELQQPQQQRLQQQQPMQVQQQQPMQEQQSMQSQQTLQQQQPMQQIMLDQEQALQQQQALKEQQELQQKRALQLQQKQQRGLQQQQQIRALQKQRALQQQQQLQTLEQPTLLQQQQLALKQQPQVMLKQQPQLQQMLQTVMQQQQPQLVPQAQPGITGIKRLPSALGSAATKPHKVRLLNSGDKLPPVHKRLGQNPTQQITATPQFVTENTLVGQPTQVSMQQTPKQQSVHRDQLVGSSQQPVIRLHHIQPPIQPKAKATLSAPPYRFANPPSIQQQGMGQSSPVKPAISDIAPANLPQPISPRLQTDIDTLLQGYMNTSGQTVAHVTDPKRKFFRTRTITVDRTTLRDMLVERGFQGEESPQLPVSCSLPEDPQDVLESSVQKPAPAMESGQSLLRLESTRQAVPTPDQSKDRNIFTAITPTGSPMAKLLETAAQVNPSGLYFDQSQLTSHSPNLENEAKTKVITDCEMACELLQQGMVPSMASANLQVPNEQGVSNVNPYSHVPGGMVISALHEPTSTPVRETFSEQTSAIADLVGNLSDCAVPRDEQLMGITNVFNNQSTTCASMVSQTVNQCVVSSPQSTGHMGVPQVSAHQSLVCLSESPEIVRSPSQAFICTPSHLLPLPTEVSESPLFMKQVASDSESESHNPPELTCSVMPDAPALTASMTSPSGYDDTPPLLYDTQGNIMSEATALLTTFTVPCTQNISGQTMASEQPSESVSTQVISASSSSKSGETSGKSEPAQHSQKIIATSNSEDLGENFNLGGDVDPTLGLKFTEEFDEELCKIPDSVSDDHIDAEDIHVEAASIGSYDREEYTISQPEVGLMPGDLPMARDDDSMQEDKRAGSDGSSASHQDEAANERMEEQVNNETQETNSDFCTDDSEVGTTTLTETNGVDKGLNDIFPLSSLSQVSTVEHTDTDEDEMSAEEDVATATSDADQVETLPINVNSQGHCVEHTETRADEEEVLFSSADRHSQVCDIPSGEGDSMHSGASDSMHSNNADQDSQPEITEEITEHLDPDNEEPSLSIDNLSQTCNIPSLVSTSGDVGIIEHYAQSEINSGELSQSEMEVGCHAQADNDSEHKDNVASEDVSSQVDMPPLSVEIEGDTIESEQYSNIQGPNPEAQDPVPPNREEAQKGDECIAVMDDNKQQPKDLPLLTTDQPVVTGKSIEIDTLPHYLTVVAECPDSELVNDVELEPFNTVPVDEGQGEVNNASTLHQQQETESNTEEHGEESAVFPEETTSIHGDVSYKHATEAQPEAEKEIRETDLSEINNLDESLPVVADEKKDGCRLNDGPQPVVGTNQEKELVSLVKLVDYTDSEDTSDITYHSAPINSSIVLVSNEKADIDDESLKERDPVLFDLDDDCAHTSPDADHSSDTPACAFVSFNNDVDEESCSDGLNDEADSQAMVNASTQTDEEEDAMSNDVSSAIQMEEHSEAGLSNDDGIVACSQPSVGVDGSDHLNDTGKDLVSPICCQFEATTDLSNIDHETVITSPAPANNELGEAKQSSEEEKGFTSVDDEQAIITVGPDSVSDNSVCVDSIVCTTTVKSDVSSDVKTEDLNPIRSDNSNEVQPEAPPERNIPKHEVMSVTSPSTGQDEAVSKPAAEGCAESSEKAIITQKVLPKENSPQGYWNGYKWVYSPKKKSPPAALKGNNKHSFQHAKSTRRPLSKSVSPVAKVMHATQQVRNASASPRAKIVTVSPRPRIIPRGGATSYIVKIGPDKVTVRPQTTTTTITARPVTNNRKPSPSPVVEEPKEKDMSLKKQEAKEAKEIKNVDMKISAQQMIDSLQRSQKSQKRETDEAEKDEEGNDIVTDENIAGAMMIEEHEERVQVGRKRKLSAEQQPVRKSSRPTTQMDSTASAFLQKISRSKSSKRSDVSSEPGNFETLNGVEEKTKSPKSSKKSFPLSSSLGQDTMEDNEDRHDPSSSISEDSSADASQDEGTSRRSSNCLKRIMNSPGYIPEAVERKTRFGFLRHPEREEQAEKKRAASSVAKAHRSPEDSVKQLLPKEDHHPKTTGVKESVDNPLEKRDNLSTNSNSTRSFQQAYTTWFQTRTSMQKDESKSDISSSVTKDCSQCDCHKLPSKYKCWNPKCSRSAQVVNCPPNSEPKSSLPADPIPKLKSSTRPIPVLQKQIGVVRPSSVDGKRKPAMASTKVIDITKLTELYDKATVRKQQCNIKAEHSSYVKAFDKPKLTNNEPPVLSPVKPLVAMRPTSDKYQAVSTKSVKKEASPRKRPSEYQEDRNDVAKKGCHYSKGDSKGASTNDHHHNKEASRDGIRKAHSKEDSSSTTRRAVHNSKEDQKSTYQRASQHGRKEESKCAIKSTHSDRRPSKSYYHDDRHDSRGTSKSYRRDDHDASRGTSKSYRSDDREDSRSTSRDYRCDDRESSKGASRNYHRDGAGESRGVNYRSSHDKREERYRHDDWMESRGTSKKSYHDSKEDATEKTKKSHYDGKGHSKTGNWRPKVTIGDKKEDSRGTSKQSDHSSSEDSRGANVKGTHEYKDVHRSVTKRTFFNEETELPIKAAHYDVDASTLTYHGDQTVEVSNRVRTLGTKTHDPNQSFSDASDVEDLVSTRAADDWTTGASNSKVDRYAHIKTYSRSPRQSKS